MQDTAPVHQFRIYKYDFQITDFLELSLPEGAEILHVQEQNQTARLWALVDTTAKLVTRKFSVVGTGAKIPFDLRRAKYIATFSWLGGAFIWHLFELTPE
jgi:hypothetical protein